MVINNIVELASIEGYIPQNPNDEPISLADAKLQCRVDFTDDDTIIQDIIYESRSALEEYCRISLVPKNITLSLEIINSPSSKYSNPANRAAAYNEFELPNGPVLSVQLVTYIDNNNNVQTLVLNTDYFILGTMFKSLRVVNNFSNLQIVFSTGYTSPPPGLIGAIKKEIAFRYDHRGDEVANMKAGQLFNLCPEALRAAKPFRRNGYFS